MRPGQKFVRRDLDCILDAPLLVAARHPARHGPEAVMARVGQEARVEPDELPPPLRNDRRGVVVPALADHPAHKRAGLLVAPAERLEGLAEGAHHGEQPGGAEHQHERGDGAADPEDVAELPPVDLGRLPGREGQRDERFGGGRRMELPHAARSALIPPR